MTSTRLPAGTRIGVYEVVATLGAGGMGEVYRARDTTLGRSVALKILPADVARDPERLARFEREARTLASLNHPYIAQVYGFDRSGDMHALAMELVEGEDLSQRLARGAIPSDEALPIARQLADALEAAHDAGIIHRDLKPANIKVRSDGTVKVLDFGLAKAVAPAEAGALSEGSGFNPANSPTITNPMTVGGMILGTAAYMAPEQARGRPVDKRADIWAFGVVLYEMLTGKRMFDAESIPETLGLIFTREPELSDLPATTSPIIRSLIARCLVKDPRQRLRDIGEARVQIDEARAGRGDGQPIDARTSTSPPSTRPWVPWAVLPLVAVAAAAAGWFARPVASPVTRLSISLPAGERVTTMPAISRDGRTIAYAAGPTVATSRLYIRTLDDYAARPVAGSTAARHPFFSPDGRSIAFFAEGKLRRAPVAAPVATDIARAPEAWGGTWGADDRIVYVPIFPSGLWRIAAGGGVPEQLTKPDGAAAGYAHVFPQHVAESGEVLFGYWGKTFYTALLSVADGTWREITRAQPTQGLFVGTYAASGHVLAGDIAAGVRAAEWKPATTTPVNPEIAVLDAVYSEMSVDRPWLNVSETGTAVYVPGNPASRRLVWVDRHGRADPLPVEPDQILRATVSHDGRRIAYDLNRTAQWIVDLATSARTRITSDVRSWHGAWLPGDERLVVSSNRTGDWDLYTVGTRGSGELTPLLARPFFQFPQAVAPDGTVIFQEDHPVTGLDLWTIGPDGKAAAFITTPFNENQASVSPDGRFVAYVSDESGRAEVYAMPMSAKGARVAISLEGGTGPVWSRDGRELFYRAGDNLVSVDVKLGEALVTGARRVLLDLSDYEPGMFQDFDVSADGQRFLLIRAEPEARPTRLNVIVNWSDELTRLARSR